MELLTRGWREALEKTMIEERWGMVSEHLKSKVKEA